MKNRNKKLGAHANHVRAGDRLGLRPDNEDAKQLFHRLCEVQSREGHVPPGQIEAIANETSTAEARVLGVGSFYSLLDTKSNGQASKPIARICDGPTCCLKGALELLAGADQKISDYRIERTSCLGYCDRSPTMLVDQPTGAKSVVADASWEMGEGEKHNADALPTPLLGIATPDRQSHPLTHRFDATTRFIYEAIQRGAYDGLKKAMILTPTLLIDEVDASGLRGRGGAGFRTGKKWRVAAGTPATQRYVVCNADESEPGTFKDRVLMENDPHAVVEGMTICAKAIGASQGIIYIRGEYQKASASLMDAIHEARERKLLGKDILGRGFDFDITIHHGAGAYVCGEESALLESVEGKRGEPRERPPYPATAGLWGKPTVVNNVETLCSVPAIVLDGANHYQDLGIGSACGTKLYCLSGHLTKSGVCEAPEGVTTRQLIETYGGGMQPNSEFKFALTGGAAGTFLPDELLDVPLSYDSFDRGVALGSGAVIVAGQSVSAAEMLLWVVNFFVEESCGKCTPCRVGTVQVRDVLKRIVAGDRRRGDVDRLLELAKSLEMLSLCGLGMSVAWPIESALRYFRDDFI